MIFLICVSVNLYCYAQNDWSYMNGDLTVGNIPSYGTKNIAAASNLPAAKRGAITWTDASGDLWMFGGDGTASDGAGLTNDLWKYVRSTKQWIWVSGTALKNKNGIYGSGVPSVNNYPGAREFGVSWLDGSGNVFLYGGFGLGETGVTLGYLNDLWKYNLSTNEWTWVNGGKEINNLGIYANKGNLDAANIPGGRQGGVAWKDSNGFLWMMSGLGYGADVTLGRLNDLWKYDVSTNTWAWMRGDKNINSLALYSSKGVTDPNADPGSVSFAYSWTDQQGNFWLFGGTGYNDITGAGLLNDIWYYDVTANEWAWMGGRKDFNSESNFGVQKTENAQNEIGSREKGTAWVDAGGKFWLFGGFGTFSNVNGHLNDLWKYNPTNNLWTWMGGDQAIGNSGIYGTKGVANNTNHPGSRRHGAGWFTSDGKLWLFGGQGYGINAATGLGYLNDLWQYSISDDQWTWTAGNSSLLQWGVYDAEGVENVSNKPGGREKSISWTDNSNNVWIFGGRGYAATGGNNSLLSDLWKYNSSTGKWAYIKGSAAPNSTGIYGTKQTADPANKPGARQQAVQWTDAQGNLWLFGGNGYGETLSGYLNDLWKYNITDNKWTWVHGEKNVNVNGVYSSGDPLLLTPGSRERAVTWTDALGNFWLFGGWGYGETGSAGFLNDLWKFDINTNLWTFINGNKTVGTNGEYGTVDVPDNINLPGARASAAAWFDGGSKLWMFGGEGYEDASLTGYLNDVWAYDMTSNQWVWKKGNKTRNAVGTYGTIKTSAPANTPGGRMGTSYWLDNAGNFWMAHGFGYAAAGGAGYLNDLWRYSISNNQWSYVKGDNVVSKPAVAGASGVTDPSYNPGARYEATSSANNSTGDVWVFGGYGVQQTPNAFTYLNDLWKINLNGVVLAGIFNNFYTDKKTEGVLLTFNVTPGPDIIAYKIEHSTNGLTFSSIEQRSLSDHTQSAINVSYLHDHPAAGVNYYRIAFLHQDNSVEYSSVKKIAWTQSISAKILGNPSDNLINFQLNSEKEQPIQATIISNSGNPCVQKNFILKKGLNTLSISLSALGKGGYFLRLYNDNFRQTLTFLKQ